MTFYYLLTHKIFNVLFRVFYGLRISGVKHRTWQGGLIVASNHQCFMDPIFLGVAAPREMFYFAKEEIFSWPFIGYLARKYNAFPTKRGVFDIEAIRTANRLLQQQKLLLVFIEGTRSRTGELLPPKLGVGMMAWQNQVDIIPAYIYGSYRLRRVLFHYPGLMIKFGDRISMEEFSDIELPRKEIYNLISHRVMEQIKALKTTIKT